MIDFNNENIDLPDIDLLKISTWVSRLINENGKDEGDISYIFCNNDYILQINQEYLNHNYFTDIITFNYNENNFISGDIFISLETVEENANYYDVSFINELLRVIIHGILHLLGYDDQTDLEQLIMTQKEDEALNNYPL